MIEEDAQPRGRLRFDPVPEPAVIAFRSPEAKQSLAAWYPRFLARIPGPTEQRTVPTPFGDTHVLLAGPEDAPPLVVVHGAMASSAHVVSEIAPLARTHRVIAPDVIGQSPMSADGRIPHEGVSAWLLAVLDALGLDHVGLVGVSWGGFIAVRAASAAPHRFDRLALLVPAGVVATPALPALWNVALPLALWRLFGREASFQAFLQAIFTRTDEEWAGWIREAMEGFRMDFAEPPRATPAGVEAWSGPVLVVAAEMDLSFPGEAVIARVRELFPHAEAELIPDARHAPPMDDAFRGWLGARLEAFLRDDRAALRAAP